jgi:hypothetical protein
MLNYRFFTKVTVAAIISVGVAFGNINIPVVNHSFETIPAGLPSPCGTGCSYSSGSIPGWTITGGGGQFQPGFQSGNTTYLGGAASDGTITSAYSNGGVISQTVGSTVQVGAIYTLLVDIGNRYDASPAGTADLLINGTKYTAIGTVAAEGGWSIYTASYTGLFADAGQAITIELNSSGSQGNYDNVQLSATPEPGFYGLLTLGISGLAFAVNRRRKA